MKTTAYIIKFRASDVFLDLPPYRKFDKLLIIISDSDNSLTLFFNKEDVENALNVLLFYIDDDDDSEISINDFKLKINTSFNSLDETIEPFLNKKNKIRIFAKNQSNFEQMKHLVIYKIVENKDDEYYLRAQLDELLN